ncbi:hypothetical protein GQ54DRAFT_299507 [Martensiomyces pterosporus]|nr:hypothetical protein GQ54DRAFT_299507 [Martensiomyces pterosporus]
MDIERSISASIDSLSIRPRPIVCHDPPCSGSVSCPTTMAYERHYDQVHRNKCSECGAILPSAHWLDLHIQELHDMFFRARVDRGDKAFQCFLPSCTKVFATPRKRKMHMVDKHHFARSFNWALVRSGLQPLNKVSSSSNEQRGRGRGRGRGELGQHPQSAIGNAPTDGEDSNLPVCVSSSADDMDVDQLASAFKRSVRVGAPKSISFGRRGGHH